MSLPKKPYECIEESRTYGWRGFQLGLLLLLGSLMFRSSLAFVMAALIMLLAILYVRFIDWREYRLRKQWVDDLTGRNR